MWASRTNAVGLIAAAGLASTRLRAADGSEHDAIGLGGVIVAAPYRGHGLARRIVTQALELAATLGPELAVLFCLPSRIGLYERLGFSRNPPARPRRSAPRAAASVAHRDVADRPPRRAAAASAGGRPHPAVLRVQKPSARRGAPRRRDRDARGRRRGRGRAEWPPREWPAGLRPSAARRPRPRPERVARSPEPGWPAARRRPRRAGNREWRSSHHPPAG